MAEAALRIVAPAKINLHLGVHTQIDGRGYHRVDSVMAALDLADIVTMTPGAALSVTMTPAAVVESTRNTAYRAAIAMEEAFHRVARCEIVIEKHIPLRAGLGGPSADAGAVILGLCRLWRIDPADARVAEVARGIGADVPFSLGGPLAFCTGAGDVVTERFSALSDAAVALVKPNTEGVSAREAYERFDEAPTPPRDVGPLLDALRHNDLAAVIPCVANNLMPASRELDPEIGDVLRWLRPQTGVRAAELSGSGSCAFAICETTAAAASIVDAAAREQGWWAAVAMMGSAVPCIHVI